ncbi:hypothetical protein [Sedimentisphaera salicampi]|uniref:hypothetical protein n=1 Tax=Sedimentisphaera salicampi TaxID=1941349 RepID=UPI000B9C2EF4|nr:hypothetical protein [Sedimentisphaera salicampi]OXU14596.1 hypothetical protein SMSP1_01601 [Sedimentisphaera salicampi]
MEPYDWNVIVAGAWNPAIFTPQRVAKNIFGLEEYSNVKVYVSVDGAAPTKIEYNGIIVAASNNALVFSSETNDFNKLVDLLESTIKTLEWLKETPIVAGGFNIRYKLSEENALKIQDSLKCDVDGLFAQQDFEISKTKLTKSLKYESGFINIAFSDDKNGDFSIEMNFNLSSSDYNDIKEWFSISKEKLKTNVGKIINNTLGLNLEFQND